MRYNVNMKIRKDDLVKLVACEPDAVGRVVEVMRDSVLVQWQDGIKAEHDVSELRQIRLDEFPGPWSSFYTM